MKGPALALSALFAVVCLLAACDSDLPAYVAKQGFRHGALLLKAESVEALLKRSDLDPTTEHYLRLSREVLGFARGAGMRTGSSYSKFIRLDRGWVTQIVMAARPDRLEPKLYDYPIVGQLPYRGFYDEADAIRLESELRAQGLDVYRREVDAFSTTGWLPDPLVSTMFDSESRIIELLFHELTHSTFYFASQADFNEAFASWMGYRLALDFVAQSDFPFTRPKPEIERALRESHEFQLAFASAVKEIVAKGHEFYAKPDPSEQRAAYFAWIRARLGADSRFAKLALWDWNNALILSLGTYYESVGPIEAFALANGLGPREFLARVVERGPGIIPEVLAPRAIAGKK